MVRRTALPEAEGDNSVVDSAAVPSQDGAAGKDAVSPAAASANAANDSPVEVISRSLDGLSVDDFEAEFGLLDPGADAIDEPASLTVVAAQRTVEHHTDTQQDADVAPDSRDADSSEAVSSLAPLAVPLTTFDSASAAIPTLKPVRRASVSAGRRGDAAAISAVGSPSAAGSLALGASHPRSLGRQFGIGASAGLLVVLLLMLLQGGFGVFTTRDDVRAAAASGQVATAEVPTAETFSETEWEQSAAWDEELAPEVAPSADGTASPFKRRVRRLPSPRAVAPRVGQGLGSTARFPEMSPAEKIQLARQLGRDEH